MAKPTVELISAILETAHRLQKGIHYQWTHMGSCNCGHLVQTVTKLSKAEIHAYALQKAGDWNQKAIDYCPESNFPIDHIITALLELGLNTEDICHLERLSSPLILKHVPAERKPLRYDCREDVIYYLFVWAEILETQLTESIDLAHLPEITNAKIVEENPV